MVHLQRTHLRLALGDRDVPGSVVSHQHDVVLEVHRVVLGEGSAHAEGVQDLHGLNVLDFVLAGDRHAARRQQRVAEDDGADGVLVLLDADAHVVVRQRAEIVQLHQPVERDGRTRRAFQFRPGAVRLHVEDVPEVRHTARDLFCAHVSPQGGQLVDLEHLDVAAEGGAVLGQVGVDVEHPPVVVTHQPEPVVEHHVGHARGVDPGVDLGPAVGIVLQHPGDLVEVHARAAEDVGNLGNRTGAAVRQPLAGHRRAVVHAVERLVVDRRRGLEVEHDDRDARALDHGQDRGRQRVGRDV